MWAARPTQCHPCPPHLQQLLLSRLWCQWPSSAGSEPEQQRLLGRLCYGRGLLCLFQDTEGLHGAGCPPVQCLLPSVCMLCVFFVFVTYLTHQSCTRYAQQLLIPPVQPLFIGSTHRELCFMSAGNSKQTVSLPHWPSSVSSSCGWRLAGVCPPAVAQNTDQARCSNPCNSSSFPGFSDGLRGDWDTGTR